MYIRDSQNKSEIVNSHYVLAMKGGAELGYLVVFLN
jgi:hypothetical protein